MTDGTDEIIVQLQCPHCHTELQRTLPYLRTHRSLRCDRCGQPARYGDVAMQRVEELLRRALN